MGFWGFGVLGYWDSVVVKQADVALFGFWDGENENNSKGSFYEIGKL